MPPGPPSSTTRRQLLAAILAATAGCHRPGAQFLSTVPFDDEGQSPLDTPIGDELDGRLYADLSRVGSAKLITPTDPFYVRTRASHLLPGAGSWAVQIGARHIPVEELVRAAEPQGTHLMECAGNTRAVHFGMLGIAGWDGVPLSDLLERMSFPRQSAVLVSGFDEYAARPSTPSIPGASWIFSRQQIEDARAFLAVQMDGQPLARDHGAPVRLVLPGWYGCACIKWVNRIVSSADHAQATSQMREYAARTHQRGLPERAADYQPATIDPAAMPVRVEQWRIQGKVEYKVTGIVWGGSRPAERLLIRFGPEEPYVPVPGVQAPPGSPWGLWTYTWIPRQPGLYRIRLRLADATVRTRRLDSGFYVRQVRISRV